MIKLAQNSSVAHRDQGTNWLGRVIGGCQDADSTVYPDLRNLGCGGDGAVLLNS